MDTARNYRVTCRNQRGDVIWSIDMTVAEYERWLQSERERIEAAALHRNAA
jgi:hypothetical protein